MIGDPHPTLVDERSRLLRDLGPEPSWWRFLARRRWRSRRSAILAMDVSVATMMLRELYPADRVARAALQRNRAVGMLLTKSASTRGPYVEAVREPGPVFYVDDDMEVGKPHQLLPPGAVVKSIDRATGKVTYEVP